MLNEAFSVMITLMWGVSIWLSIVDCLLAVFFDEKQGKRSKWIIKVNSIC
mgnify:CR=1 FL=1